MAVDLIDKTCIMRWILTLHSFVFKVEHIKGKDNVGADFLSRVPEYYFDCIVIIVLRQAANDMPVLIVILYFTFFPSKTCKLYCLYGQDIRGYT